MNSRLENELGIALWLANNTDLPPHAISGLCPGVHLFKSILLRSGTCLMQDVIEVNPISAGIFTEDEIKKYANSKEQTRLIGKLTTKRYISRILRPHIPGVIVWLHKNYPNLPKKTICQVLGTTTKRINEVLANNDILPVNPVSVQILTESALKELVSK